MRKRISTCDNHSASPRCVVEEEVRDIQLFQIPGNVAIKDRVIICVLARAGKEFFDDADVTRFKITAWKMHSLAEH